MVGPCGMCITHSCRYPGCSAVKRSDAKCCAAHACDSDLGETSGTRTRMAAAPSAVLETHTTEAGATRDTPSPRPMGLLSTNVCSSSTLDMPWQRPGVCQLETPGSSALQSAARRAGGCQEVGAEPVCDELHLVLEGSSRCQDPELVEEVGMERVCDKVCSSSEGSSCYQDPELVEEVRVDSVCEADFESCLG